jgi:NADH-quinone oxidoreductase subunit J
MLIEEILFYAFASLLIASASMVVTLRNPVRCALALVTAFVASAVLWLLVESEFLALILVLVYVGAVMTLFLFVVMMLNLQQVNITEGFVRYLPFGILIVAFMVGMLIFAANPEQIGLSHYNANLHHVAGYSNMKAIGQILYTEYAFPLELAAVLLLIAIVAGISLAFRGLQRDSKAQMIMVQLAANKRDRLRLISHPKPNIEPPSPKDVS